MRFLLLLAALGLLFGIATAAPLPADTAAVRVDHLPATGLTLEKGWRYHAGDDPAWARPGFDDRAWDTLNPARPRRELPAVLGTGISWLRLSFHLADSLRARAVLLQASGYGAWEIYLDGRLVQRAGTVQAHPTDVRNPDQPQTAGVPAGTVGGQVLAIRFAPWQSPLLRVAPDRQLLSVLLCGAAQVRQQESVRLAKVVVFSVLSGVFGLLAVLHLAFFRYYPAQRANLYFAFFALAMTLLSLNVLSRQALAFSGPVAALLQQLAGGPLMLGAYLWAVRALYALFGFRPGWLYKGLWTGFWVTAAIQLYDAAYAAPLLVILLVVAIAELLRLTRHALRRRQRGVWLIGVGFGVVLLLLLFIAFNIATNLLKISGPSSASEDSVTILIRLLLYLAPALGISLYLAREFALDAELLQVKLSEVERLSAQTLAQEQEKQALLAAQNGTLETQVAQRTGELQRSLMDLRATQAQLIQKEKMASLGELTAGIAHEIQNPLNFVNNFSEVSTELMAELQEAQAAGDAEEVAALAEDVTQNLGKISHHGRRAAAIVKGMLEHSRTSTGERAPTDLNQLCDEYLRLAYQGLRAKDKSFNAALETDFAPGLAPVSVVGADVGRVLLNLFGNAFYAVQQRQQIGEAGYAPTVSVSTRRVGEEVEIRVRDNGVGIPDGIKAKIFQPFFTTKPTGEGTGLGLSLSHDIIAQGHGGRLAVASQAGKFTEFLISLPLN
ncbi:ATP-binding protein [Hymenobacter sp. M29]|uniref:histidine kinase n=1 Tax=Hymenobacter mellowenesis TaxID=3063995 RepID=A0ABT9A613_9BACT|nr:ATP-binding protein [Hymenobacter sp. M29]MDO7845275.1 ATP-binding protein [Hymenobacter sp. M29]